MKKITNIDKVSLNTQIILLEFLKRKYEVNILFPEYHFASISNRKKTIFIKSTNLPINNATGKFIVDQKDNE